MGVSTFKDFAIQYVMDIFLMICYPNDIFNNPLLERILLVLHYQYICSLVLIIKKSFYSLFFFEVNLLF